MDGIVSVIVACAVCHGAQGISTQAGVPHLAGQPKTYLEKQIKDFRDGKRKNSPHMSIYVKGINDEEAEELAKFFSEQTRCRTK